MNMHASGPVELRTLRLRLWMPAPEDAVEMTRYQDENRLHLGRWSPAAPADLYSVAFWQKRLARNLREYDEGKAARFAISWRDRDAGRILGTFGFTDIRRGPVQASMLGYGLDRNEQNQGIMTEALRAAVEFAFTTLALHRIQATYSPDNRKSGAVLKRLGFVIEGYARSYLFVNGVWQDHILAALINPQSLPVSLPPRS